MDIQIKNEEEAVVSCINGKNSQKKLSEAINKLQGNLTKIKSNWESTGADKESYIIELEKQMNNLVIIGDVSLKFFKTIESYIARVRELRARTVDSGNSGGTLVPIKDVNDKDNLVPIKDKNEKDNLVPIKDKNEKDNLVPIKDKNEKDNLVPILERYESAKVVSIKDIDE